MARMSEMATVLAKLDADIDRLTHMRDYLTAVSDYAAVRSNGEAEAPAPRKRGRKPKAKGEPAAGTF